MHFMNILTVFALSSRLLTLKARITIKSYAISSAEIVEASLINSADPDQTAPV